MSNNNNFVRGSSSRDDAQRGAGYQRRGGSRRVFPSYEEAWAPRAGLLQNPALLARMPWVLPRVVENEELVLSYISGKVFPSGTPVEGIYSYDWRNRIAVPDSELNLYRYKDVTVAREKLLARLAVRHRRHHLLLRSIPRDHGVDAYAFRTLGEIGYVNELVELDVSRWYGRPGVDSSALCWAAPILKAEFPYSYKPRLFWEWTQWERRIRARSGLLIPYRCIEAEELSRDARHRRYVRVPAEFSAYEMSPGCRAKLPPVVTYKASALAYDPNSGFWTVFYTELAARVAVWVLWDLYDTYRLWYVPRKLREDMRGLQLDFVLGSRENEKELHRLLSVIDSIDRREAEFMYTKRDVCSFEDSQVLAPGDYVWYDPWRREIISREAAMARRQHNPDIPSGHARGFVNQDQELQNEDLEVSEEDEDNGGRGVPANDSSTGAPSNSAPRRQSVGMSSLGPVIRTFRETDELDLSVPENFRSVRVFLRDCGVDANEMPRSSSELKDWLQGRLNRTRTVLCSRCVAGLCEACFHGYRNCDPVQVDASMDVEPEGGEDQSGAQDSGADGPTATF